MRQLKRFAKRIANDDGNRLVLIGAHVYPRNEPIRVVPASVVDALREEVELSDSLYEEVLGALEDAGVSHVGPADGDGSLPHRSAAERVGVLAAERDTAREALREIADVLSQNPYLAYRKIAATLANGPLATAPGGEREDECFRLREERDALRAENEDLKTRVREYAGLDEAEVQQRAYVTHEHHLRVIRALVAERDALRAEVEKWRSRYDAACAAVQAQGHGLDRYDVLASGALLECDAARAEVDRLAAQVRELEQERDEARATVAAAIEAAHAHGFHEGRHAGDCEYYDNGLVEGARQERERLREFPAMLKRDPEVARRARAEGGE